MNHSGHSNQTNRELKDRTHWLETPWLMIKGFLMGTADIIPGVSGGTMALITGIYDRLIYAVRSVDSRFISSLFRLRIGSALDRIHWKFLMILLSGIALAVVFFTRVVPLQLYMHTHPELIYGLFFGLILGSVFVLLKEIEGDKRSVSTLLPLLAGTVIGYQVVTMVPAATPDTAPFLFLSGLIAFCAMILPGISGSYLLVILGKYDYVLSRLGELGGDYTSNALLSLIPLFLGGAVGLALFSRIITWLLRHYHTLTIALLTGFLLGSLILIWPFQERIYEEEVTQVEVLMEDDPVVQQLMDEPEDPNQLRYRRLAPPEPETDPDEVVRLEHVERKLVDTTPYIPGNGEILPREENLKEGLGGVVIGLVLVAGLDYLRRKQ